MHEPEEQLGAGGQAQRAHRREVRFVVAVPGYRHVYPVRWASEPGNYLASEVNKHGHVARLDEVLVSQVAIAEVESELNGGRECVAEVGDPAGYLAVHIVEG